MATTRIMPMHIGSGRTIAAALDAIIDYAENPDKTNHRDFVTTFQCNPGLADVEFLLTKRQYEATTGRDQGERNVLAYQIRQSFKPGEITPEEANRIGYELAMRFTKGKHQFIVATHIDKAHIHNHIIFNSTRQDGTRKFRNFWGSTNAIRQLSDTLCVENGLSIVEEPKEKGKDYGTWLGDKKPHTYQEQLRQTIEKVLAGHPTDFADFIQQSPLGYTVEQGKHVKFKAADQKKYTRLRALGEEYTEETLKARIAENLSACPATDSELTRKSDKAPVRTIAQKANVAPPPEVNLLIDLQNSLKAKDSPGYMKWAKKFNLKQAAQTLLYLEQHNLMDYDTLAEKATAAGCVLNLLD